LTTILIVDDHPVVREGLSSLFETVDGMSVVAESSNGADAVSKALSYRPDVVLMDLNMPDGSGIDATRAIAQDCPECKVLVLTMSEDSESIADAMPAGARGYILKGASQHEIIRAVDTVASGGALFSATIADQVLSRLHEPKPGAADFRALPALTTREHEILVLLAKGARNRAIAEALGISAKTVANHLSMIFTKLGVEDRSQAIITAREAGLGATPEGRL
jgi:DNA-binding NarL/FixJ family response regulator